MIYIAAKCTFAYFINAYLLDMTSIQYVNVGHIGVGIEMSLHECGARGMDYRHPWIYSEPV